MFSTKIPGDSAWWWQEYSWKPPLSWAVWSNSTTYRSDWEPHKHISSNTILMYYCSWIANPQSPNALRLSNTNQQEGICNKGGLPVERVSRLIPLHFNMFYFFKFSKNMWSCQHIARDLEKVHASEGALQLQHCLLHIKCLLLWTEACCENVNPQCKSSAGNNVGHAMNFEMW